MSAEFTGAMVSINFRPNETGRNCAHARFARWSRTFCRGGNQQFLQQHGISSEQAASGREALEFLRLYDYDLVLMDLHLPDVPAYEVVRMMRAAR